MLTLLHVVQRQDAAHSGGADCAEYQDAGIIASLGNLFVVSAFQRDIIVVDVFERFRLGLRFRLGFGLRLRFRFGLGLGLGLGLGFRFRL